MRRGSNSVWPPRLEADSGDAEMKMKKKAVVAAVSLALGAPLAWGQEEEPAGDAIVLYGKLYPELNSATGKDPTPAGSSVATPTSVAPTGVSGIIHRTE